MLDALAHYAAQLDSSASTLPFWFSYYGPRFPHYMAATCDRCELPIVVMPDGLAWCLLGHEYDGVCCRGMSTYYTIVHVELGQLQPIKVLGLVNWV